MTKTNPNKTPLILIVDDDRTMRSLLNLAMEEEGYQIALAKNGEQCLCEYAHFQPDLILLDAVMPDLDGFTCCKKIRSLPGGDRVPILIITVLDDRESVEQAFNAGATDYITKPIHWTVLSQRVRSLLNINKAWLEVNAVKEELRQQQAWEELIRNILQQLSQSDLVVDSIQQILTAIREWLKASRVLLYQSGTQTNCESVAVGFPGSEEFSGTDFNLVGEYGEQYQQGKTVVIGDVSQANLPSALIEQFQQLNTQALSIVPIIKDSQVVGLFSIHFCQTSPPWKQLTLNRLADLGKLLAMTLE